MHFFLRNPKFKTFCKFFTSFSRRFANFLIFFVIKNEIKYENRDCYKYLILFIIDCFFKRLLMKFGERIII